MKKFLTTGFCLLLGLSLVAGCGGGSAISSGVPQQTASPTPHPSSTPTSTPTSSSPLTLVNPPPSPAVGNVGQPYIQALIYWVQGGVGPITFSLKSGTLPAGLTLTADGDFDGIPTAVSESTVVITATDSGMPPSSVSASITITINPMLPLTIAAGSGALPAGTVGAPYNQYCYWTRYGRFCHYGFRISGATGGVVPYVFSWAGVPGSSLPPGLNMDSSGLISGTPTAAGTYNFVVTVNDSESPPKQASANYTIAIAPAPSPSPSPSP